jgi:hypothetical protein
MAQGCATTENATVGTVYNLVGITKQHAHLNEKSDSQLEAWLILQLGALNIAGLKLYYSTDPDCKTWPIAATDGKNCGWIEKDRLYFWGLNNPTPILKAFRKFGLRYEYEC